MTVTEKSYVLEKKALGFRHIQVLLLFLAMVLCFMFRVNMSMALIGMTDAADENAFDWSVQSQSTILSAFKWGYVVTQFPGGELAARFGGKVLILICIISNVIISLGMPTSAYYGGWKLICVCRVLQGIGQGFLLPSTHNLITKWVPLEEKNRLGSFIYAGAQLGIALQNMISGFIINMWGWPAVFYVNAIIGFVWVFLFITFASDSPQTSRWISVNERFYIQTSLGQIGGHKKLRTPWKKMFPTIAFISIIVANFGHVWGFWTLMNFMPMYLSQVQGVNIKVNGLMSALPYLALFVMSFPVGYVADLVIKKKWLSLTVTRKIFNTIGSCGPAIALIGLAYAPTDVTIAVSLLTLSLALNAGYFAGYTLAHIDLAPNFAGTMNGITSGFANTLSIFAPLAAGFLLTDEPNPENWRKVFYLTSAIFVGTNTFYVIFGSSKKQPWNEPEDENTDHVKT